jgi:DNA-binding MarR family transcriptional regulator
MMQPEPEALRAWQLLVRFFFAQREHLLSSCGEPDLSPIQFHVLHLLEPGRPVPMGQLAQTLACHASNVTGLVDRLEARGLVERRLSAEDRRVKVLELTSDGLRVRAHVLKKMTTGARPLCRLSRQQQHALVRILEVLVEEPPSK